MAINPTIKNLLQAISTLPAANHILVFGSVAKGSESPGDLDLVLNLPHCDSFNDAKLEYGSTIATLRRLSYDFYGSLDPFVATKSQLVVRNEEATGWTLAKNARSLRKTFASDGLPIAEVLRRIAALAPEFAPKIDFEHGHGEYNDGRVRGSVEQFEADGKRGITIHEWTSLFPGQGHTAEALSWLREQGYEIIAANGVGLIEDGVGDIATAYWQHMHSRGLVDVLIDDLGVEITPEAPRRATAAKP